MSIRRKMVALLGLAIVTSASSGALAGIADSPLPVISGSPTIHAFTITGVQSTSTGLGATHLETEVFCTSLEPTNPIKVGVEVFSYSGGPPINDVSIGNGAVLVAPGQTVTIATGDAAAFLPDFTIIGLPQLSGGSARIVSTSKRIVCSVAVVDSQSSPPQSMVSLQVIKGRAQRGN